MATNEQIIARIDTMEKNMGDRFERNEAAIKENEEAIKHQDDELRGNGEPGIKSRLSSVEKYINETKKWQAAVFMIVLADIVTRIWGVVITP